MTFIELFVRKVLDDTNIWSLFSYVQDSFYAHGLAVLEVIWGKYPNGYYRVARLEIRDPRAYKVFSGEIPARKFLVFEKEPTEAYFVEIINRDLVKWLVDVNFKNVEYYPIWEIPKYV